MLESDFALNIAVDTIEGLIVANFLSNEPCELLKRKKLVKRDRSKVEWD